MSMLVYPSSIASLQSSGHLYSSCSLALGTSCLGGGMCSLRLQVLVSCLHLFPFHLSFLQPLLVASVLDSGCSEGGHCGPLIRHLGDLK